MHLTLSPPLGLVYGASTTPESAFESRINLSRAQGGAEAIDVVGRCAEEAHAVVPPSSDTLNPNFTFDDPLASVPAMETCWFLSPRW
jgi:hypothetical protein